MLTSSDPTHAALAEVAVRAAGAIGASAHRYIAANPEDVDKAFAEMYAAGALADEGIPGSAGAIILTSRISVEMVQKTAAIGAGIVVGMSAPTALAIRTAEATCIAVVGIARGEAFEIFSHSERICAHTPGRI